MAASTTLLLAAGPSTPPTGFGVLGHVLSEYVAPAGERGDLGALLDRYVLQPILAPLGLGADAGYALTPAARARLAPGYDDGASRCEHHSQRAAALCAVAVNGWHACQWDA